LSSPAGLLASTPCTAPHTKANTDFAYHAIRIIYGTIVGGVLLAHEADGSTDKAAVPARGAATMPLVSTSEIGVRLPTRLVT
jgi:hypothetical protein